MRSIKESRKQAKRKCWLLLYGLQYNICYLKHWGVLETPGLSSLTTGANSVYLRWGQRFCTSTMILGDADAAAVPGPQMLLWEGRFYRN
jgi:hypothetical protein